MDSSDLYVCLLFVALVKQLLSFENTFAKIFVFELIEKKLSLPVSPKFLETWLHKHHGGTNDAKKSVTENW